MQPSDEPQFVGIESEGYRARVAGRWLTDNPYQANSTRWQLWRKGWIEADLNRKEQDE